MKKECEFIEVFNKTAIGKPHRSIFVPSPESFFGGWARHQWLKSYFKQECSIASSALWQTLIERHGSPKILIEQDGVFTIMESTK
jgi:hypothetical protein